jgi:O-methyltransferase involved in polyketide biosynthesis
MTRIDLQGVARTLLVPLACRAMESPRADSILRDPRAVEVFNALGGNKEFLMGMSGHDLFAAVMRVRKFDTCARDFLARNPGGVVVDIGCGLDTRFERLDDGNLVWIGVDLPEVIHLRHGLLPDSPRSRTIARSMLDLSWIDVVSDYGKPVIFLAEGVFPYFSASEVKPLLSELKRCFSSSELVFDALSPLMAWIHNHTNSVLKRSGTAIKWDIRRPEELGSWGLTLLERWGYFERPEPRLGAASLIRFIPPLANATYILHYRLGN